jgi:hypothetical protein
MRESTGTVRTGNWDIYLRGGAVILAAFVVTGLIFTAAYRMLNTGRERVGRIYNRTYGNELAPMTNRTANAPGYSPGSPFGAAMPAGPTATSFSPRPTAPTVPVSVAPPPPLPALANSAFPTEERRREAQAAVAPLREVISTVRRYDSQSLWAAIPDATAPGSAGSLRGGTAVSQSNAVSSLAEGANAAARHRIDPAIARQQAMEKIINEADALGAEIVLLTHPDRFPEPLRDAVGEFRREVSAYLKDVQFAAIHPDEREQVRPKAQKHLARGEEILNALENATGGRLITGAGGL